MWRVVTKNDKISKLKKADKNKYCDYRKDSFNFNNSRWRKVFEAIKDSPKEQVEDYILKEIRIGLKIYLRNILHGIDLNSNKK